MTWRGGSMVRRLFLLLGSLLAAGSIHAEVAGNNDISVIDVSQTITLSRVSSSVTLQSAAGSAKKYYARIFTDVDSAAPATTSSPIYLEPGASFTFTHDARTESGSGYRYVSLVCAAGETATARLVNK
jgi:hypothetical protein